MAKRKTYQVVLEATEASVVITKDLSPTQAAFLLKLAEEFRQEMAQFAPTMQLLQAKELVERVTDWVPVTLDGGEDE